MSSIIFNGKLADEKEPLIPASGRGLRYGDGLFETMRWQNGNLQFANEHFAMLWKGMKYLQFDIPVHFTPEMLQEQIEKLVKKNRLEANARIRLTVFRGAGGLYDAVNHLPNYIIESWQINPPEWNSNGLVLGIYKDAEKACSTLSNIKSNNCLPYVLGALHAKKQQWNDALILNQHGNICETTIANIFIIKNEVIITPPLSEGCVEGILRKQLLDLLQKNHFTVLQKPLTAVDLQEADECFTTNSIHIIKWVKQVGDKSYSCTITEKIFSIFTEQFVR